MFSAIEAEDCIILEFPPRKWFLFVAYLFILILGLIGILGIIMILKGSWLLAGIAIVVFLIMKKEGITYHKWYKETAKGSRVALCGTAVSNKTLNAPVFIGDVERIYLSPEKMDVFNYSKGSGTIRMERFFLVVEKNDQAIIKIGPFGKTFYLVDNGAMAQIAKCLKEIEGFLNKRGISYKKKSIQDDRAMNHYIPDNIYDMYME